MQFGRVELGFSSPTRRATVDIKPILDRRKGWFKGNKGKSVAGAAGLEPATCGFGDRRSTN